VSIVFHLFIIYAENHLLAGLDITTRSSILELLHEVHAHRSPRIVLGSRLQDGFPEWISHVAFVEAGSPGESWSVRTGTRKEIIPLMEKYLPSDSSSTTVAKPKHLRNETVLVEMNKVRVSYHGREVSAF
jgi:hypothetical protein